MNSKVLRNLNEYRCRRNNSINNAAKVTNNYMEKYLENINEDPILREARALRNLWEKLDIYMYPDDIIVGRLMFKEPVMFHFSSGTFISQDNVEAWAEQEQLDSLKIDEFMRNLDKIESRRYKPGNPEIFTAAERVSVESTAASSTFYGGHLVMDYENILQKGLEGYEREIYEFKINAAPHQKYFYEAMETLLQGIKNIIFRHAEVAEKIAHNGYGEDHEKFTLLSKDLKQIAFNKPETFRQALQLVWFIYILCDADSFGRFDWYLYPFFKGDMEKGRLDLDTALELLEGFWIRIEEADNIQNMTLGGRDLQGRPFYTELTRLCLQATRIMGFKGPNLCIRVNDEMPEEFWNEIMDNLSTGQGVPAIYNDDVYISLMQKLDIPMTDALNFSLAGCSQANIPGASYFANDIGIMNIAKCLELTYSNGYDFTIGKQVGLKTGSVEEFKTFNDFLEAFKKQLVYFCKLEAEINNKDILYRGSQEGYSMRTLFTSDCLKKGKGVLHGGARYNNVQLECIGITNAADSLIAIKKAIYEEKKISFKELVYILRKNFQGHEDIRNYLKNTMPKYGNDIKEVDDIRKEISEFIYKELRKQKGALGGNYIPGEVIFITHESNGRAVGATPDGREAQEVLADSAGAGQGFDKNGPTALLNSVLKIPNDIPVTSVVLNLKFTKGLWKEAKNKIVFLFKSFLKSGGMQFQVNVCDSEILKDAIENPDKYNSLIIRVGGYSAYFTSLSEKLQREIIARTEY